MELNSKITQTADSIRSEVSDLSSDVGEVKTAVQEITPNYIINTVTSSATYKQDLGAKADASDLTDLDNRIEEVNEAVLKITPEAIISAVTNSVTYKNDMAGKADISDVTALETRISSAEQKITADAIVSTVTSSTTYKQDLSAKANANDVTALATRISTAEQKITAEAIINTVTSSATYKQDLGAKANTSDLTDLDNRIEEVNEAVLKITPEAIISTVTNSATYKQDLGAKADASTVSSQITQTAAAIRSEVSIANADLQSQITQNANNISLSVKKDGIISAINLSSEEASIKADKIKLEGLVTANNYFKINADGSIVASSGTIGGWTIGTKSLHAGSSGNYVSLSTGDSTYAIWAGANASNSAPFRVAKDGSVYLTKLYVTDENGVAQQNPVDLRTSYWKVDSAYAHAVKTLSVADNTLTITLYNGTSVNFKKAATGTLVGSGNGSDNFTISYVEDYAGPGTGTVIASGYVNLKLSDPPYSAASRVIADFGKSSYGSISVGDVYTAGVKSVTVDKVESYDKASKGGNYIHVPTRVTLLNNTASTWMGLVSADCSEIFEDLRKEGANSVTIPDANIKRAKNDEYSDTSHNTTIYVQATASNGAVGSTSFVVSGSNAYLAGRQKEAETLAISSSTTSISPLGYGKSVTITAITTNNPTGKSITITAPEDNAGSVTLSDAWSGSTYTVTASNQQKKSVTISVWGNSGSTSSFTVNAGVSGTSYSRASASGSLSLVTSGTNKVAKVTIGGVQVAQTSLDSFYKTAVTAGANSLAISPTEDKTLEYGKSVTVTATTTDGSGAKVEKKVTITAPEDRYDEGETHGILAVRNNSVLSIEGTGVTAKVVAKYSGSKYNEISLQSFYSGGVTTGATSAIKNASLSLVVSDDGKTATGTISTLGVDTTKTISSIDVSKAYNVGVTYGESNVTISNANIKRSQSDSYSDNTHNTTIYIQATASNGAVGSTSFVVSGSNAFAAGRKTEAGTLAISPSSNKTLGYGESVTVKATTTNNTTGKSITITAPEDNASSVTISSLARDGETSQSGKVCSFYVKATASNGATKTQLFSTTCDKIYQNGWDACKPTSITGGTPSYKGNNQYTISLTAKNSAGTVVGTGSCSVNAQDAYEDGYILGDRDGRLLAAPYKIAVSKQTFDESLMRYDVDVIVTTRDEVEHPFELAINAADSYMLGATAGYDLGYDAGLDAGYDTGYNKGYTDASPTNVTTDVSYNSSQTRYDVLATVHLGDKTTKQFVLDPIKATSAYNAGWNDCRYNAERQAVLINYYTAGETLYDRDGNVATGPWYKGTQAYRYTLPGAK